MSNSIAGPSKDFKEDQLRLRHKLTSPAIFKTEVPSNDDPG